ncbi:hypothetical protein CEXT_345741, partial [Caerostris extrusa]
VIAITIQRSNALPSNRITHLEPFPIHPENHQAKINTINYSENSKVPRRLICSLRGTHLSMQSASLTIVNSQLELVPYELKQFGIPSLHHPFRSLDPFHPPTHL